LVTFEATKTFFVF